MHTTIIVNAESMGQGDPGLGAQLLLKCLHQLCGASRKPQAIVFYNSGVKLLVSGSPVLDVLRQLERDGVDLVACGTCVDFYQLRSSIAAARVSDMREIVTMLMASSTVITI
jgi:intracellular sulfur oxidation DsrE/DsrF family protein